MGGVGRAGIAPAVPRAGLGDRTSRQPSASGAEMRRRVDPRPRSLRHCRAGVLPSTGWTGMPCTSSERSRRTGSRSNATSTSLDVGTLGQGPLAPLNRGAAARASNCEVRPRTPQRRRRPDQRPQADHVEVGVWVAHRRSLRFGIIFRPTSGLGTPHRGVPGVEGGGVGGKGGRWARRGWVDEEAVQPRHRSWPLRRAGHRGIVVLRDVLDEDHRPVLHQPQLVLSGGCVGRWATGSRAGLRGAR